MSTNKKPKPIVWITIAFHFTEEERILFVESLEKLSEDYHVLIMEDIDQELDVEIRILSQDNLEEDTAKALTEEVKKYMNALTNG